MVFGSFLRKSASSLAPLAVRLTRVNRNYHPSVFTASDYLYQKPNLSTFLPNLHFSSAAKIQMPSYDESLIRVIDSEIKCAEETNDHERFEETPNGFPFKVEDNPGQQTMILTRDYQGEPVKFEAHVPVDNGYDMEIPAESSIQLLGPDFQFHDLDLKKASLFGDMPNSLLLTLVLLSLSWHMHHGIKEIITDYVHHEMTRNLILIYLGLFIIIFTKDAFLAVVF